MTRENIKAGVREAPGEKTDTPVTGADETRLEFHRDACALLPQIHDARPGIAFCADNATFTGHRSCTCSSYRSGTCPHILELTALLKGRAGRADFRASLWYQLAALLAEDCRETPETIKLRMKGNHRTLTVVGADDAELLTYLSQGADQQRFVERFGLVEGLFCNRGEVLDQLARLTMTGEERLMLDQGIKTRRLALEGNFWHRALYHAHRELDANPVFRPGVDQRSGAFTLTIADAAGHPLFRMTIPRVKVERLLETFRKHLPNQHGFDIHPVPLKSIFKITMNTALDLDVMPMVQMVQANGESRFYERGEIEKFRYGNLVYVKELGILAELERGVPRKFTAPARMVIKQSQVPGFLQEFADEIEEGTHIVDAAVKRIKVFDHVERVDIALEALERDWCWLSVRYGIGNTALALEDILRARAEGQRYLATDAGWIDCQAPDFAGIDAILGGRSLDDAQKLKLSRLELFRLAAVAGKPLCIVPDDRAELLQRILALRPSSPPVLAGLTSALWPYQVRGVEWLSFLGENGLGGLLCDDMGLGKTHQVMAHMVALRARQIREPFLVVCPTTVLSHWETKLRQHAPGLGITVYHGYERELGERTAIDVLVTTYGIMRNDIEALKEIDFALAVFDEAQNLKNPQTGAYKAAMAVRAAMKLGLTGTPIENSLLELKALFDLVVPGYLGGDEEFKAKYLTPGEEKMVAQRRAELARLIVPFTLRRLKKSVLTDLPEKIEDFRSCLLSEDQIKLYRDAIATRGEALRQTIADGVEPIPYIHIFALLNLLKQICNHPALVQGPPEDYSRYESGKWELFKELIAECHASSQKVVVYSQYLDMLRIMELHLQAEGIDYVTLTGASTKRGEIVARFQNDPDCRIFLGSLKAGGVGIDLVAASVVIHYDRWWNAAKEDQATDRVHRIGQTRGVQVFKLVTEGTLEEKIAAIIAHKRSLLHEIVREDDPGLLKIFSREELMTLLTAP